MGDCVGRKQTLVLGNALFATGAMRMAVAQVGKIRQVLWSWCSLIRIQGMSERLGGALFTAGAIYMAAAQGVGDLVLSVQSELDTGRHCQCGSDWCGRWLSAGRRSG